MKLKQRSKGVLLVVIATMLWGVSGTVAEFLFKEQGFNAEWLVDIRLLASGILLLAYASYKKDTSVREIWTCKKDWISLFVFSILGVVGAQYTYFACISYSNAATATILQYLNPVIITCFVTIRMKKLPNKTEMLAICLAIIGTGFIITKGDLHSLSISGMALFWGILSAFASAVYTLQPISLLKKYSSIAVIGWGMLIGGILFAFVRAPWQFTGTISPVSILGVLFVVLFGTLIAFYCYLESLNYIKPTEASILGCIEPLSAAFLSVLWLKTPFGFFDFTGTACIIITIMILSLTKNEASLEPITQN
ncbi:MAG: DMT family transporter [bacterium]|nr:DMT family transporter [bacterium]